MRYKKYFYLSILVILVFMGLCGCSKSEKSEKEIVHDLQASSVFISSNIEISDYEVIKRQTNFDEKLDLVYITVHTNDPELTSSLTFELTYQLYNDGWVLESITRYQDGPWEFTGLQEEQLLADIKNNDYYFSEWDLEIVDFEITEEVCDSTDRAFYEKQIATRLTAHNPLFDYYSFYNMYYEIVNGTWELQSAMVENRGYSPTYSPDITASDQIVEELKLRNGTSETTYDNYEYLKTETDWYNCTEVRYYTATKDWWFGTESYLISIPIYFSLENGDESTYWTFNPNNIESSIQSVDWNLEGNWVNKYDASHSPYITVNMEINSLSATNDLDTYSVSLSCDASSSKFSYLCKTYGNVNADIKYMSPGEWILRIDDTTAEVSGHFMIIGYSAGATHEGFWWVYSTRGALSSECQLEKM